MTHSHCESSPGLSDECRLSAGWPPTGATENARPENAGLENDGQTFSKLLAKLRGLENAGLKNDGQHFSKL